MRKNKNLNLYRYNPATFSKNIKDNVFYKLFTNPSIYLQILLGRTLGIGFFTFLVWLTVVTFDLHDYTIPPTMHSLIGIVIGLLLVFRTNTAYDRWWDARKLIASLSSEVSVISSKLNSVDFVHYENSSVKNLKISVLEILNSLKEYLKSEDGKVDTVEFHIEQTRLTSNAFRYLDYIKNENIKNNVNNSLLKIMEYSNQLERIKNTPIPLSYIFHIKISVLIYLLTLPFGMFHDLGFASIPLVMVIYYIMVGVEIISSEIENPFAGDPNDLPIENLFNIMEKTINS
jgi:putative membrane protein